MGRISPLFSVWDGYPCQETPPSNVPSATTNCSRRLNKLKDAIQITNRSNIPPPTFRYGPHASCTDTAHHLSAKYGWRNWWNICSLVDVQRNDSGCLAWHELSHKSDLVDRWYTWTFVLLLIQRILHRGSESLWASFWW